MSYTIIGSSVVTTADPAASLAGVGAGVNQSVYLILSNSVDGPVGLTVAGADTPGALVVPADGVFIAGPFLGRTLADHGLFSGESDHDVKVTAIAAPGDVVVDRRRGGFVAKPAGQVPFEFRPLLPEEDPI